MSNRFAVFALLLCPLLSGQQSQQQPAEAVKPSVVHGTLTNSKTGEPVRRATLSLRPMPSPSRQAFYVSQEAAPYTATTGADGKYRIEGVEAGSYSLSAERQGFVRAQYGSRGSFFGTTIKITSGQEMTCDFAMTPQAVITGRVLDDEGEPMAHVFLQVMQDRYFRGKRQPAPMGGGQTNDEGEFRIADLAPGRYYLSATRSLRMMGEAPPRNPGSKPEEDFLTTYYPGVVDLADARPVRVTAGQEAMGMDIRMQKGRVYRVSGKVAGVPTGTRTARLALYPRDRTIGMMMMMGAGAMMKEDGTFVIGSVTPGSYYLSVFPFQQDLHLGGRVAVDVGRENVENVILTLLPGTTLVGNVRLDPEAPQTVSGKKISLGGIRVQLSSNEGLPMNLPGGSSKDDGTFTLENVAPQKYKVIAYNLPEHTWLKAVRAGDANVLEAGLDLSSGALSVPIELTLGVGGATVSGSVRNDKGDPASGGIVTVLPDPYSEDRADAVRVTTADQDGQFTLSTLPPGSYRVYAWQDVESGAWSDPEFVKAYESHGTKLKLENNATTQVSLVEIPAAVDEP